jgi:hypothetical protein
MLAFVPVTLFQDDGNHLCSAFHLLLHGLGDFHILDIIRSHERNTLEEYHEIGLGQLTADFSIPRLSRNQAAVTPAFNQPSLFIGLSRMISSSCSLESALE